MGTTPQALHDAFDPASAKIAIVDDEPINVKVVRKHLQRVGYDNFVTSSDSVNALGLLVAEKPDVVLLDVMMPEIDGIEILRGIRANQQIGHTPVLILTASTDAETKLRALNAGATDFLAKPVDTSELAPRLRNALVVKAHHDHLERYSEELERKVRLRTAELEMSQLRVIHCLARAAEFRDDATGRHVIRVGRYATILARQLGYSEFDAAMLGTAALLHDVGKIGLPDAILLKPGKLEPQEREAMQRHCEIGSKIVEPAQESDWLSLNKFSNIPEGMAAPAPSRILTMAATIALTHHERWDGAGYPRQLAGEQIPLPGRIVAAADFFDAVSSARPYKEAFPPSRCLEMMRQGSGTHFDPKVVDALFARLDEIQRVQSDHADPPAIAESASPTPDDISAARPADKAA